MIRRKKRTTEMVPVAAMADIAFLLIIFFMLTSNFIKEKDIKYDLATSMDIKQFKATAVSVIIDENSDVHIQGKLCSAGMVESEVRDLMEGKKGDDRLVMLKVDKNIPEEIFYSVLLALTDADVKIATIGKKTK